jgi:hypothetical protein
LRNGIFLDEAATLQCLAHLAGVLGAQVGFPPMTGVNLAQHFFLLVEVERADPRAVEAGHEQTSKALGSAGQQWGEAGAGANARCFELPRRFQTTAPSDRVAADEGTRGKCRFTRVLCRPRAA